MTAVAVALLLWSSAFVAIRHLADVFSPGGLALGRLLVASLLLGVLVARHHWVGQTRGEWLRIAGVGLLWYAVYSVALNTGERRVDAGTAAMVIQVSPVLVAVLATLFLNERATMTIGIGLAVAFAGVALIATSTAEHGNRNLLGVVLCFIAAAAYSISVILQKPVVARVPALQVTWLACTIAAIACLPFGPRLVTDIREASPSDIAWMVYLGALPTAVAFTLYAYALNHMKASSLSSTTYLVPFITVVMSWLFLGEAPHLLAYVGGAVTLLGVGVTRYRPRIRAVGQASVPG